MELGEQSTQGQGERHPAGLRVPQGDAAARPAAPKDKGPTMDSAAQHSARSPHAYSLPMDGRLTQKK